MIKIALDTNPNERIKSHAKWIKTSAIPTSLFNKKEKIFVGSPRTGERPECVLTHLGFHDNARQDINHSSKKYIKPKSSI
jgi:hypothetical protein